MLTQNEREAVCRQLISWPKRQANRFLHTVTQKGQPITTERQTLALLRQRAILRFAAPEVAVATLRQELTYAGIEQAFRDLSAFCRQRGYIYLELLENNPEFLGDLMAGHA